MTSLVLEKCKNERVNIPKIILVQGFCQLKIKVAQFPNGFRLKSSCSVVVNKPFICMQQLSQLRK